VYATAEALPFVFVHMYMFVCVITSTCAVLSSSMVVLMYMFVIRILYTTIYSISFQAPVMKQESDGDFTASVNDISSQEEDGSLADNMTEGMDNESSQSGRCV